MKLQLKRPICFFDLETTGVQVATDRIVEIAILKINPNGSEEMKRWLVNPEMPIPQETTAIHGISDEMVADAPTFKAIAKEVYKLIKGCDLGGYNLIRFDVPMLAEEFLRADVDVDFSKPQIVDVQNIFHKKEQRTLSAAYRFYCEKDLTDAHSADADTRATYEVLLGQLDRYDDLPDDVDGLAGFSVGRNKHADLAGFLHYDEKDQIVFGFGKFKGQSVTAVLQREPGYLGWLLDADFPRYTKKIITQIKLGQV